MKTERKQTRDLFRFGIGEWYGKLFIHLTPDERFSLAQLQLRRKKERAIKPCPPRSAKNPEAKCSKEGGICSLRLYKLSNQETSVVPDSLGNLVTTCPYRFDEGNVVVHWVGETILGQAESIIVNEVGFLEKPKESFENSRGADDVGRIDMVLVNPLKDPLLWCALEKQAVYFFNETRI
jgi:hypothetical protein